jgi:hypothetical protein
MPGFGKLLPRVSDAARQFFGIHARRYSGHKPRSLDLCGRLNHRIERIDRRHRQKIDRFAFFLCHLDHLRE